MLNIRLFPELFEDIDLDELVAYTANELDDGAFQGVYTADELEAGEHYSNRMVLLVSGLRYR